MEVLDNVNRFLGDDLKRTMIAGSKVAIAASCFSIFAFEALRQELEQIDSLEFIFTTPTFVPGEVTDKVRREPKEFHIPQAGKEQGFFGTEFEIRLKNRLTQRAIARECADWIRRKAKFRSNRSGAPMQQFACVAAQPQDAVYIPLHGFTAVDLGYQQGNAVSNFVNRMDDPVATRTFIDLFEQIWKDPAKVADVTDLICDHIASVYQENSPQRIYFLMLYSIFSEFLEDVSEDVLPNERTGYQDSVIWQKLYHFQKDAATGIINKLETYNGCILADSVGLGKTFTALAVIKYYELRNRTVLVLCPKKLADNWTTYKGNLKNNPLLKDRFSFDVLCHTDLLRERGESLGIPLSRVNWSNYDLVVIDESHNFRNDDAFKDRETRYQWLMNRIIKQGVRTKVLMLSATPVNNRFNDLKNQLALAYEGEPDSLSAKLKGSRNIDQIFRRAQAAFNAWSKLPAEERTPQAILASLDFDFFELLDSVTIARSRRHITTFYDTKEIGEFPTRRKPLSFHCPLTMRADVIGFNDIFVQLTTLRLGVYTPVTYILPIDFDQLRQELSDSIVEGPRERYHLDWPGKREAILAANAPIAKTLRPCRAESVDFDTTKNLFIEGDNLDALKLLQETYLGKIKLIYIDPPYNTGTDFIYEDDFSEGNRAYLLRSNQEDEDSNRMVANTEANGRFHSDWLSMIYPRLKLARNLLRADGLIMISIDDHELPNLRRVADEIFGDNSFLIQFVWRRRSVADSRNQDRASSDHEYVVCYKMPEATLRGKPIDRDKYLNPDNDPRGPWFSDNLTGIANREERPNLHYDVVNPETGDVYPPSPTRGWYCAKDTMAKLIEEKRILWPAKVDGRPRHKKFLNDATRHETGFSSWLNGVGQTSEGTQVIQELFGEKVFPFTKPLSLMRTLIDQATTNEGDLILDFFAGAGTTGHATIEQNSFDSGKRRYILVQLPESIERKEWKTLADLTKERLRRAGAKIKAETALTSPNLDTGFRVLKIDASNMRDVYYSPDAVAQGDLLAQVDNIRPDRTPEDLLFHVLVDWGLDLALPIAEETIGGKTTFFVDGNALAACFDAGITDELVKEIAKRKPLRAVFRDASYGSDSVKINVDQIFRLLSPETEVRSI